MSQFEYMGWQINIDKVIRDGEIRFVWSAVRETSSSSGAGRAATFEEAQDTAKAFVDQTGTQPLYG